MLSFCVFHPVSHAYVLSVRHREGCAVGASCFPSTQDWLSSKRLIIPALYLPSIVPSANACMSPTTHTCRSKTRRFRTSLVRSPRSKLSTSGPACPTSRSGPQQKSTTLPRSSGPRDPSSCRLERGAKADRGTQERSKDTHQRIDKRRENVAGFAFVANKNGAGLKREIPRRRPLRSTPSGTACKHAVRA